jgi:large subunit ribosomal protein L21
MAEKSIVSKTNKVSKPRTKKIDKNEEITEAVIVTKKPITNTTPTSLPKAKQLEDIRKLTKYAVVNVNGQQEVVFEGQELDINHIGDKLPEMNEVLMYVDGDEIKIGTPNLPNIKITVENLGKTAGKKVRVMEYKAKSRYRRIRGIKPKFTRILVKSIKV